MKKDLSFFFKMHSKIIDTIEGSVALIAFVAIAVVSVSSVTALNPRLETQNSSSVAGIQVADNQQVLPPTNSKEVDINLTELFDPKSQSYEISKLESENLRYLVTIKDFKADRVEIPFLGFKNVSGLNGSLKVKPFIDLSLANSLNVNLIDQYDVLILNTAENGEMKERNITLTSPSKRNFSIEVVPATKMNFTYQFEIEIL